MSERVIWCLMIKHEREILDLISRFVHDYAYRSINNVAKPSFITLFLIAPRWSNLELDPFKFDFSRPSFRYISGSPSKFRSQDRRLIDRISRPAHCALRFAISRESKGAIDRSICSIGAHWRLRDRPFRHAGGATFHDPARPDAPFLRRPRCKKGLAQQRGRARTVPWGNGASLLSTCSTRRRKSNSAKARSLDATFLLNLAGRLFLALAWRHSSIRAPLPSSLSWSFSSSVPQGPSVSVRSSPVANSCGLFE